MVVTDASDSIVYATTSTTATPNYLWVDDAFYTGSSITTTSATTGFTSYDTVTTTGTVGGWVINNGGIYVSGEPIIVETPKITPEVQAELDAERLRRRALSRARHRVKQAAIDKADELLVSNLSQVQRIQYEKFGWFFVESESGQRYRIRKGRSINIDVMEEDKILRRICAHPQVNCPDQDTMLIQKIMLEHQEKEFLQVAHEWAA